MAKEPVQKQWRQQLQEIARRECGPDTSVAPEYDFDTQTVKVFGAQPGEGERKPLIAAVPKEMLRQGRWDEAREMIRRGCASPLED